MNRKQSIKWFFCGILITTGIFLSPVVSHAADSSGIAVSAPTEYAVYQRSNSDTAPVNITLTYSGDADLQAQLLKGDDVLCDWTSLSKQEDGTTYEGTLPDIPAGGWYQVNIRAIDKTAGTELEQKSIAKVGVGDVFITGGQSNSCNFGGAKTTAAQDIVSAYDVKNKKWQHCEDSQPCNSNYNTGNGGGSPWPSMGDALVAKTGFPVGFITTGVGNSRIEELRTTHYFAIRDAIQALRPYGCRAFLLHQGEADTNDTKRSAYTESLQKLIQQTRDDAGYDLNWMIAQVSYAWAGYNDKSKMKSMTAAQRAACNDYNIFVGPTTDDLLDDYRHTDNLHLSEKGLIEHGTRWANAVYEKMMQPYNLFVAEGVTHGKIILSAESAYAGDTIQFQLQPDEGYYIKPDSLKANEELLPLDATSFRMRATNTYVSAEFVTKEELTGTPQPTETPVTTATPQPTVTPDTDTTPSSVPEGTDSLPKKGTKFTKGVLTYCITNPQTKTVSVAALANKKKTAVTIPKTVSYKNNKFKVTAIEKKAFYKAKKMKTLVIQSTTITKVGSNAFKNTYKKLKIKVPASKLGKYKGLLKGKGLNKKSRISK